MTHTGPAFRFRAFTIACFAALTTGIFLYFLTLSGVRLIPHASYQLHVTVPNAIALADHADVTEAGVVVGTVDSVAIAGASANITLSLQPRYAPIYRDGQAQIREKSLLGENYVALDPGTPAAGAIRNGGTLPGTQPEATQLDAILSTFNTARRRELQNILNAFGDGLAGQGGNLNGFLGAAGDLVANAAPVTTVLATDRTDVAQLVDYLGSVTAALGSRAADLRRLVTNASAASSAVAGRDTELRQTLAVIPSFLAQGRATVTRLGTFSTSAAPVIDNVRIAVDALVPAIQDLKPASDETAAAISELGQFAHVATPAAAALHPFAFNATGAFSPLELVLRQLNPALAYLAPYATTLGTVFANARAATNYSDATSHYARVLADIQPQILSAGFVNTQTAQALNALLRAGLLGKIGALQSNPYPAASSAAHPSPWAGTYPRIKEDPPYPSRARRRDQHTRR